MPAGQGGGSRCAPRRNLRSTIWQMVEYKRATLRDEDALETPVEGGASPDAVEVRRVPPPFSLPPMTWPGTTRLASPRTLPRACPQLRSVSGLCAETHRGGAPSHDSAQNQRRAPHPYSRVLDPHPCFLSLGPHPCSRAPGPPTLLPCPGKPVFAAGVGKLLVFAPQSQASGIPGFPYTLPALFTYAYRWDSARGGVCAAACTHRWN